MKDEICTVVEKYPIQKKYFLLKIHAQFISRQAKPGNFVMIRASSTLEPLLKRPFGIFDAIPPHIWIYFERVGRGTRLISELNPNNKISILGPLGNSFPQLKEQKILGIAGGRGIAPIHFAIKEYLKNNKVKLVYGAKSKEDLNLLEKLNNLKLDELILYTDDGSIGKKGVATIDIREIIRQNRINVTVSCGPDDMFKTLYQNTRNVKTTHYVSLEALMGCGFGICHSCAVKTRQHGYKKVCSDGSIFEIDEIAW